MNRSQSRIPGDDVQTNRHARVQETETYQQTVPKGTVLNLTIGSRREIPGGWHSGINRVYEWHYFAHLSPAAKAIYKVLEWRADYDDEFLIKKTSYSEIADFAGVSRDSVKRQFSELELLDLVRVRTEARWDTWEPKIFQLAVPILHYADFISRLPAQVKSKLFRGGGPFYPAPRGSKDPQPEGADSPTLGVLAHSARGRSSTLTSGLALPHPRGAGSPHVKSNSKENSNSGRSVAALLESKGVEDAAAEMLAAKYPLERIEEVIATMEWRKARGKCDNPGGFIREALVKGWQAPKQVSESRARLDAERKQREQAAAEKSNAGSEEREIDRIISAIDDEDIESLAETVLKKYAGNTAVTGVLTKKPPRECRLMKMEIASLLRP